MGYSTDFLGKLNFDENMTIKELADVKEYLKTGWDEDFRLVLAEDLSGIVWDTFEKTYDVPEQIIDIISHMTKLHPNFKLNGGFECHGEERGDNWYINVKDNVVTTGKLKRVGTFVVCPECDHEFALKLND